MSPSIAPEGRIVQYLLGRMPESERLELEARLFRDEDLDEELLAATDDLIHAYLAGTLPEEDRSQFETHFLASSENREHLALMRDMLAAVERVAEDDAALPSAEGRAAPPVPRSRARTLAIAAAVTLALVLAAAVAARRLGRAEQRAMASPWPTVSATPSPETRPESPRPRVPEPATVRVVRLPGKSGSPASVRLSPSTAALRLEVPVDPNSLSFDAALLAVDGKTVWRAEGLAAPASGQPLVLEVPARIVALDRYTLRVEGESLRTAAAPVLEYRLHVVRER